MHFLVSCFFSSSISLIFCFSGKTCEDVRKHRDIRIARNIEKAKKLISKPQYKEHVIYEENMTAIQLNKTVVVLNKPRYIGMSVLDISKLQMYQFHYEYMMPKYPQAKLLFTVLDYLTTLVYLRQLP